MSRVLVSRIVLLLFLLEGFQISNLSAKIHHGAADRKEMNLSEYHENHLPAVPF